MKIPLERIKDLEAKVERLREALKAAIWCERCSKVVHQALADTKDLGGPAANVEPQANTSR